MEMSEEEESPQEEQYVMQHRRKAKNLLNPLLTDPHVGIRLHMSCNLCRCRPRSLKGTKA